MLDYSVVLARPFIPRAQTLINDPKEAVYEIASQLGRGTLAGVILFCASSYNPSTLSTSLQSTFSCPVLACTTAGEIGMRYQKGGIVAVGLPEHLFKLNLHAPFSLEKKWTRLPPTLQQDEQTSKPGSLGLCMFDAQAAYQDPIKALHQQFPHLQIVGASAGSKSQFGPGLLYYNGKFVRGKGILAILESKLPFHVFSLKNSQCVDQPDSLSYTEVLENQLNLLRRKIPDILFTLGFESFLRRQRIEKDKLKAAVEPLLNQINVTAMTSIQEINGGAIRSNTFAGVAFGAP